MQAVCKSETINVFLTNKNIYLSKESIALIVVLVDLGVTFFMYLTFVYLRAMQYITSYEVNESVVDASDFTVEIKTLPKEYKNLKDLKAKMWHYIENVMEIEENSLNNP